MSNPNFDQTVCTPEEVASEGFSGFYCYTRRQNVGLVVVSLAGFLSLAAVVGMFGLILRNIIRAREFTDPRKRRLIKVPMDMFVLSLLTADLFQSLGVVMDVRWINDGVVRAGGLCTAQGVLQNIGQAGIAMTTFIITLQTFDAIWRRGGITSLRWASVLVGIIWAFLILTVAISASVHNNPAFYAPTPYWCWISSSYPNYRIALENFWLWIGFAVSVLYIPLLFCETERIRPGEPEWWIFKLHTRSSGNSERRSQLAIICALAYCLPVLPTSLARWFLVVHGDVKPFASAQAQFIIKGIFSLSGVCDVVAFQYARSGLLLFGSAAEEASVESEPVAAEGDDISVNDSDKSTGPPKFRTHGPLKKHWKFFVLWLVVNAFDAVWITYYVRAATDPNPRTAVNRSHGGWQAYYLIMYCFGFCLGFANIVVCMWYAQSARAPARTRGATRSTMIHYSWHGARILILLPVAVILGLGPFFSPFIGVKLGQEQAWLHRCDSYPVEIVLSGLSFNAPNTSLPTATFSIRQDGILQSQYQYSLTNDAVNTSIWRFGPAPGQSLPDGQIVTYNLTNSSVTATCAGNNTTECTQGSFDNSGFLSFVLTTLSNATNVNLKTVDGDWVYAKSDDAPSYMLREVKSDGSFGDVVVRTAVTEPGHCTLLKLCANGATVENLAPVGLTLMKQNEYARVCTIPNSN
ncbi:hypothetical protein B0H17DRAFT_1061456 [Mycena rosella]|uniref:Glucose receptor Git3 N-terminal domain-containing protein n=1 Tax=Mycena rosella TaxID=1033263 RepID=A0AAD7DIW5_MYCRO|nr:hypothetical protein B0H17DRAFT_1061456 [Mycena rosella]